MRVNAPCVCGSGKKFKRCCGAKVISPPPPQRADLRSWLAQANSLWNSGAVAEARQYFQRALALEPRNHTVHSHLALLLTQMKLPLEAAEHFHAAMANSGDAAEHARTRDLYAACLRQCRAFLFATLRAEDVTAEHSCEFHRRFAAHIERTLEPDERGHDNTPEPDRRLRVGYVSPDFRRHSVAYFMEPILAGHDKTSVESYCYYTCPDSDQVTDRFRRVADHWRACPDWSDERLVECVLSDGIDILVDLAGYTVGHRLFAFARRPAPVQITYLGYPGTTGLRSMQYRIADRFADPGTHDARFTERPLYLTPSMLLYRPPFGPQGLLGNDLLSVAEPPARRNGFVTFGSFNDLSKIGAATINLWARILTAVPASVLLIKSMGLDDAGRRSAAVSRFERNGVPPDRLRLVARDETPQAHLRRYQDVDVSLDPLNYNGVTTTLESLWMGVPVVTLAGSKLSARMGVSILSNAGCQDWIARTEDEYVTIASTLATNAATLAGYRIPTRERLQSSPIMDTASFIHTLESAYRSAWHAWCRQRGPTTPGLSAPHNNPA